MNNMAKKNTFVLPEHWPVLDETFSMSEKDQWFLARDIGVSAENFQSGEKGHLISEYLKSFLVLPQVSISARIAVFNTDPKKWIRPRLMGFLKFFYQNPMVVLDLETANEETSARWSALVAWETALWSYKNSMMPTKESRFLLTKYFFGLENVENIHDIYDYIHEIRDMYFMEGFAVVLEVATAKDGKYDVIHVMKECNKLMRFLSKYMEVDLAKTQPTFTSFMDSLK